MVGEPEKIRQLGMAVLGEDGFGVKLHAEDRMAAMGDGHDLAVLAGGGDVELAVVGQFHDQGMVARRLQGIGQAFEQAFPVVMDERRRAVDRPLGAPYLSAVDLRDALMARADDAGGRAAPTVGSRGTPFVGRGGCGGWRRRSAMRNVR